MYTRSDYLANLCSHDQYYAQFVTPEVLRLVNSTLGKRIKKSVDVEYFNDIRLGLWDRFYPTIRTIVGDEAMKSRGDGWSLSSSVCIAKAAARRIRIQSLV